jgi:hypothetical protein
LLADAVAIDRALAGGVERLPGDPLRIHDPGLLGFRVAAGCFAFLEHGRLRALQAAVNLGELVLALYLDPQMIDPGTVTARRDREIDARVVQHPLGVIGLHHRRFGCEKRRIKSDRSLKIIDSDMDMEALHDLVSFVERWRAPRAGQLVRSRSTSR